MKYVLHISACAFLAAIIIANPNQVAAQSPSAQLEYIQNFSSKLTVHEDGSLGVEEGISVYADGNKIKHGIYRDFPTSYTDRYGNKIRVGFQVVSVQRGNGAEPYHVENRSNGKRIYFGDADVTIPAGLHEYRFTYTVTRELGFFADHDELYWNATGNGWVFPIAQASAEVTLPKTIPLNAVTTTGYTGPVGSKAQDYTTSVTRESVSFKTTKPLNPQEGLTIVVGWPKGHIAEPTTAQKVKWLLSDNRGIPASGMLLLLLIAYYIRTWQKYGVDPKKGTVVPQYEAPQKLSPAGIFYVHKMGYRMDAFTAATLSLAVKGYVHITNDDSRYVISKTHSGKGASPDEQAVYDALFTDNENITLNNAEYKALQKAQAAQRAILVEQLGHGAYFVNNTKYFIAGLLLSALVVIVAAVLQAPPYAIALAVIICLAVDILFYNLLRKRTPDGQKLYEEIEGFKLYMSVAEKDRLNFHNPPEQTPQLFEKLLPYALALGVEQKWAEQFADVFKKIGPEGQTGYIPLWYTGAYFSARSVGDFSSSFSSAISSSSTPPGSSSGGGGGGSSGGGGGGGGGGGW